ncbi:MAG TPA: glycerophosphodiester phosphodiesterase family protein [Bryobacteraceae bacterium]
MPGRILVHGHRGARAVLPENTLPGFAYAIGAGADFIELDTAVTRDGVVVVCHDPVLKRRRVTGPRGTRVVSELTIDALRRFDCGSLPNLRFRRQRLVPGARIPTLGEVLDLGRAGGFGFNIEVKTSPRRAHYTPPPGAYARMVIDAVRTHGLEDRVQVQSFDLRILHAVKRLAPRLRLAALCDYERRGFVALAREAGASAIGPYHRLVTRRKVERAHSAGLQVVPWTANRPRDWARLARAGVDGIITDDPAALIAFLRERGLRD